MASFYALSSELFSEEVDDNEQKLVDVLFDMLVDGDFVALCKKGTPHISKSAVLPVLLQRFAQMCGATSGAASAVRNPIAQVRCVSLPVFL